MSERPSLWAPNPATTEPGVVWVPADVLWPVPLSPQGEEKP